MKWYYLENYVNYVETVPSGFKENNIPLFVPKPDLTPQELVHQLNQYRPDVILTNGWTPFHREPYFQVVRRYCEEPTAFTCFGPRKILFTPIIGHCMYWKPGGPMSFSPIPTTARKYTRKGDSLPITSPLPAIPGFTAPCPRCRSISRMWLWSPISPTRPWKAGVCRASASCWNPCCGKTSR